MSSVSEKTRRFVEQRAEDRCEYCHAPSIIGISMEVDHILPKSSGGTDDPENLCWACGHCNRSKLAAQTAIDPETNEEIPLFNPRRDKWEAHFEWQGNYTLLMGITPTGRATVIRLKMNTTKRQIARRLWLELEIFPSNIDRT